MGIRDRILSGATKPTPSVKKGRKVQVKKGRKPSASKSAEQPKKGRKVRAPASAPQQATRPVSVASTVTMGDSGPVLGCSSCEPKSGCKWCPLFPWSPDFDQYADSYMRDAAKIVSREPDGHDLKHRCVQESDWGEVDILFVGDAPDGDANKQGQPHVGRTGAMLRRTAENFIDESVKVGYTYLIRCRPPRGKDPTKTEIASCSHHLLREVQARKPKLIVCTGNKGLNFFTGQSGVVLLNGRFLDNERPECPDTKVMGCMSPGYVLRMDHELDRFVEAIETAGKFVQGEHRLLPGKGEYETVTDLPRLKELIAEFKAADAVAFDTETGSLSPFQSEFPPLLCFSFSHREMVGYTIPLDHAESPWAVDGEKADEREEVISLLAGYFASPGLKIAQNEKFDRQHIRKAIGQEPINVVDTMLIHLVLDETRGTHGLKQLAFVYSGMGGYERPLEEYIRTHKEADPNKGGSYANIPGSFLFPYAAMDTDVTIRCYHGLINEPEFKKSKAFQSLALSFFPQLSEALGDMEYNGATIDPSIVKYLDKMYTDEMATKREEIMQLPDVQKFVAQEQAKLDAERKPNSRAARKIFEFNPGSTTQLRKVLFDFYGLTPVEMTDTGFDRLVQRHKKRQEEHREQKIRGKVAFGDIVAQAIEKREWEHFTTKADVLHEYERQGNPLAATILEYREASVLYGTFVEPLLKMLDDMLRIHGTFLIHGTVTGRLASRDPNLQNIPNKGGGLIKQAYVSRFGDEGVLMQIDYSQVELRVAGSYFHETTMIEAYINKDDLHTLTAIVLSGLSPTQYKELPDDQKKAWRTRAKRVNFGVLYGGGPPALQSTLKKDGVFVTIDECKELINTYFEGRPDLKRGIERLEADVKKKGYLESFTGRRRRVPEVFSEDDELVSRALRQSVNFPIQSGASDMTLMSIVLIYQEMKRRGLKSVMSLTVHDSIIFDCHVDEVMEVAVLAKEIMESLPERSESVYPGLNWDWLKCPIVAECELGYNWGALVEFDPETVLSEDAKGEPLWYEGEDGKKHNREPRGIDELWELMDTKAEKVAVAA